MNPIHRLRRRAFRVGMDIKDYIRKVQMRRLRYVQAVANEAGELRLRSPRTKPMALPDSWFPVARTLYR